MVFKHPILLAAAIAGVCATAAIAGGGGRVTYGSKSVALAASFQKPMQCVLDSLKKKGYTPRDVGCFGFRPGNASAHPSGHACDVDQTARNVTRLNRSMGPANRGSPQVGLASSCGAVSGCIWRHPDCGHFEAKSAPYSPAGTRPGGGGHYYGERYASHPMKRRHR